jgi:asparagine synthase (glutamine-hydrolysing)
MRNQLLRDADWAGMAHGIEIRVPLVDVTLLKSLAPVIPNLAPGMGKAALARAPSSPLPETVVTRAKTGFSVPTGTWMSSASQQGKPSEGAREPKGLVSRRWSRVVLESPRGPARVALAL